MTSTWFCLLGSIDFILVEAHNSMLDNVVLIFSCLALLQPVVGWCFQDEES